MSLSYPPKKIRVISKDGQGVTTTLVDGDTGEPIAGCSKIELTCTAGGHWQAILTIPVDLECDILAQINQEVS